MEYFKRDRMFAGVIGDGTEYSREYSREYSLLRQNIHVDNLGQGRIFAGIIWSKTEYWREYS